MRWMVVSRYIRTGVNTVGGVHSRYLTINTGTRLTGDRWWVVVPIASAVSKISKLKPGEPLADGHLIVGCW